MKLLKKNKLTACEFSISMFLLTILLIFIKLFFIYLSYKNLFPLKHCTEYFISDIYFLVTIAFFVTVNLNTKSKIIQRINNIIVLFFIILFCIDIFTVYYFQTHETIFSIINIIIYWWTWFPWFTKLAIIWTITLIILWIIVTYLYTKILKDKTNKIFTPKIFTISFIWCIIIYCIQSLMMNIAVYDTKNILSINIQIFKEQVRDMNILFNDLNYEDYMINEVWLWKDLNVILVFAESLSAIDSANAWWNDNMPNFDKIQKDWITFTNFIANWHNSKESHISLFQWLPTLSLRDFNSKADCLAKYLNNLWYNTIHISTAYLDFLNERSQLKECWFKKVVWEEAFQNKKHYVEDTASDKDLYDNILHEIQTQTWKYFISLPTMSFHNPYDCPYGDTQELCLKYADETLYEFYTSLQKIWFFESWILIIVWDHRKREPAEPGEFNLFWPTWWYKSVATIIWSWINAWSVNNNIIQHTDFYYSIKKLLWHWDVTVDKFYNDTFSSLTNRDWWIIDDYYITSNWNKYNKLNINNAKQKNPDIYNYYLSIKQLWLEDSLFKKFHKNI